MFNMLMAGAEWERDTIIERLSKGAHGAARTGRCPSSTRAAPFGYMKVGVRRESHLELQPQESATIREAVRLLLDERMELGEICRILNARQMFPWGRSIKGGGNA
jgi:DNA invertase Pin-like site-specific DNA recombinase